MAAVTAEQRASNQVAAEGGTDRASLLDLLSLVPCYFAREGLLHHIVPYHATRSAVSQLLCWRGAAIGEVWGG